MTPMPVYSIRARLTRLVLVFFLLASLLCVGSIYALVRMALIDQFNARLLESAVATSARVTHFGTVEDTRSNSRAMRAYALKEGFFELWDSGGGVLTRSANLTGDLPRRANPTGRPLFDRVRPQAGRALAIVYLDIAAKAPLRDAAEEADEEREHPGRKPVAGPMLLAVAMDRQDVDDLLASLALICGAAILVLSAAAFLIPPILRRLLRPLEAIADRTRAIDAQSLSTRLPVAGLPEELAPIATRLNDLFARLESAFERERRVTADLAHELRTPLAELRTWADAALKWPESRDPATDSEIRATVLHMQAVVTRMLALARSELGAMPVERQAVHIDDLLRHAFEIFSRPAAERHLRVDWQLETLVCETDPALMRSIIANLYDNAVEYTPPGGVLTVHCASLDDGPAIAISNSVADIQQKDLARFFERFWRKEEARTGEQHFGLGLSIAQSFARNLGLRLEASLCDSTLTFTLTPQAKEARS
jgi:two-component system sensor histidine kinase QseC